MQSFNRLVSIGNISDSTLTVEFISFFTEMNVTITIAAKISLANENLAVALLFPRSHETGGGGGGGGGALYH